MRRHKGWYLSEKRWGYRLCCTCDKKYYPLYDSYFCSDDCLLNFDASTCDETDNVESEIIKHWLFCLWQKNKCLAAGESDES